MTQTYKVQVSMNQAHLVESGFVWKQGDFGFNLEIEVMDFDTTGVTPQIIFRKSAGAVESTSLTQSGNKFTYTVRGTELDTPGPCICDLKLKSSTTQRISTASFKYFTIPDTMDGLNQQADSYSDTIAQIIEGYEEEIDNIQESVDSESEKEGKVESRKNWAEFYSGKDDCLLLTDESGYIGAKITRFGDIKTKTFDSHSINKIQNELYTSAYDIAIADSNGKIGAAFKNGYIIPQKLYGKKLSILGDSISTMEGYIPSGYSEYYPQGDVTSAEDTWWGKLIKYTGMTLLKDCAWGGSTVTGDSQGTAAAGCSTQRISDLADGDIKPDIIIVFIGTNDWAANAEIGDYDASESIPSEGTITVFSKAYALMLSKIRNAYPLSTVYCATILPRHGRTSTRYPLNNENGDPFMSFNDKIRKISQIFGCNLIDTEKCGVTFWNIVDNYSVDGWLHPNSAGMTQIAKQARLNILNSIYGG